jgi:hypothetical protein
MCSDLVALFAPYPQTRHQSCIQLDGLIAPANHAPKPGSAVVLCVFCPISGLVRAKAFAQIVKSVFGTLIGPACVADRTQTTPDGPDRGCDSAAAQREKGDWGKG